MTKKLHNILKYLSFSFICPKGKENEVIELFKDKQLGLLNTNFEKDVRHWINQETGKITSVSGFKISGLTDTEGVVKITKVLSERKIASYSRETQILFKPIIDNSICRLQK